MRKIIWATILATCLMAGCAIGTTGEASWELCLGFKTKQISDEKAEITISSSVVDKVVDSLTDGKVTEAE